MNVTITPSMNRGLRVVKIRAVINKSERLKIPRRYQKTWNVKTVAPEHAAIHDRSTLMGEAVRWEISVLEQIRKDREIKTAEDNLNKLKQGNQWQPQPVADLFA